MKNKIVLPVNCDLLSTVCELTKPMIAYKKDTFDHAISLSMTDENTYCAGFFLLRENKPTAFFPVYVNVMDTINNLQSVRDSFMLIRRAIVRKFPEVYCLAEVFMSYMGMEGGAFAIPQPLLEIFAVRPTIKVQGRTLLPIFNVGVFTNKGTEHTFSHGMYVAKHEDNILNQQLIHITESVIPQDYQSLDEVDSNLFGQTSDVLLRGKVSVTLDQFEPILTVVSKMFEDVDAGQLH